MAAENGWAEIRVKDTGAGIAPELADRVFEPFVQADQRLDRSKGGLGLGLALVRGLAEMHGGSARASSEGVGKGFRSRLRSSWARLLPPPRDPRLGGASW